ncbi:MAG: hypothetical protein MI974_05010 [Chitinophagales bacterium]|nr:hypothetical protein [Chitinophagales bacterium]
MASTNPRSPLLLKGAFVEIGNGLVGPIPNVIIFQYNPEQLSRNLKVYIPPPARSNREKEPQECPDEKETQANARPIDPSETISLTLDLDAADALEQPASHPIAVATGIADRLAAFEQLLYPKGEGLLGGLVADAVATISGADNVLSNQLFRESAPLVLFVWGPGKIFPVRITNYSVTEQAFSPILYPIRAQVNISMKILQPHEMPKSKDKKIVAEIAAFTYRFYRTQQQALATANVANTVESILGMLPF